jgi:hypothetical protein
LAGDFGLVAAGGQQEAGDGAVAFFQHHVQPVGGEGCGSTPPLDVDIGDDHAGIRQGDDFDGAGGADVEPEEEESQRDVGAVEADDGPGADQEHQACHAHGGGEHEAGDQEELAAGQAAMRPEHGFEQNAVFPSGG